VPLSAIRKDSAPDAVATATADPIVWQTSSVPVAIAQAIAFPASAIAIEGVTPKLPDAEAVVVAVAASEIDSDSIPVAVALVAAAPDKSPGPTAGGVHGSNQVRDH
jgi:hypothetical protein